MTAVPATALKASPRVIGVSGGVSGVAAGPGPLRLERARGTVRIAARARAGRTHIAEAYQSGSSKVRFPRQFDTDVPEAVLLNTAGGITGGDRFDIDCDVGAGAALTATSQAAERVYRSPGGAGRMSTTLRLHPGARLDWLPHETILFNHGRLERRLDVEMAADASLVLCEAVVLGRAAHGETVDGGLFRDRWRIRRDSRLVYADTLLLDWGAAAVRDARGGGVAAIGRSVAKARLLQAQALQGEATLAGARAFASLLVVAADVTDRLEPARAALAGVDATGGASAWDGLLSIRLVAADAAPLRAALLVLLAAIGVRVPRAWMI